MIGWTGLPIVAELIEQLWAVVIPDQFAEAIEQFDDGNSLLGRPVGRNGEGHGEHAGRGRFHDVAPWCTGSAWS